MVISEIDFPHFCLVLTSHLEVLHKFENIQNSTMKRQSSESQTRAIVNVLLVEVSTGIDFGLLLLFPIITFTTFSVPEVKTEFVTPSFTNRHTFHPVHPIHPVHAKLPNKLLILLILLIIRLIVVTENFVVVTLLICIRLIVVVYLGKLRCCIRLIVVILLMRFCHGRSRRIL